MLRQRARVHGQLNAAASTNTRKRERMRHFVGMTATVLTLVFAGSALAADPTVRAYGGQGGAIQRELDPPKAGRLPFTGLDLGLLVGGGMVLVLVGGSLWRLSSEKA
jgi:hypothetical protein